MAWLLLAIAWPARASPAPTPFPVPPTSAPRATLSTAAPSDALTPPELVHPPQVVYPAGAEGAAEVLLELTVERDGSPSDGVVIDGAEPFASAALEAARSLRFWPARRGDSAVRARIRFLMTFAAPASSAMPTAPAETLPAPTQTTTPAVSTTPASGAPPEPGTEAPSQPSEPPVLVSVRGVRPVGSRTLLRAEVRRLPGAFGNPFRAIEAQPGVVPTLSGFPYFYVRGAPPGNVGYFLDAIRLPSLYHVFAGPSVVHPALIDSVDLYPAAAPARYGGATGGVAAATLRPAAQTFGGEASVRLFDTSALVELPLAEAVSLTLGGRRSYATWLARLFAPQIRVDFWDYQARLEASLGRSDQLRVFVFGSRDDLREVRDGERRSLFESEFHRAELRYVHRHAQGEVWAAGLVGLDRGNRDDQAQLDDRRLRLRAGFDQTLSKTLQVSAGMYAGLDRYASSVRQLDDPDEQAELERTFPSRDDGALGAHVSLEVRPTRFVRLRAGVRGDAYRSGRSSALGIDPHVAAEFDVSRVVTLTHAVGISQQLPSDAFERPGAQPILGEGLQTSIQSSGGVKLRLPSGVFVEATAFQNVMLHLTDATGISRLDNRLLGVDGQSRSLGSSRGIELLVRRSLLRSLGGYLAYTLASSRRSIGRAEGPALFDRRHTLSAALALALPGDVTLGARGSFYTGIPGDVAYLAAAKDPPRTSPFARLDVRAEKRWRLGERASIALVLEMLNATLAREPLNLSCSAYVCRQQRTGPVSVPSLGVEATF